MTATVALSTALSILGVTGQIVASRNAIIGWTISIAAQPLWYAFYITVGGWPLLILSTGYLIAALLNLRTALRPRGVTLAGYPAYAARSTIGWLRNRRSVPSTS